MAKVTRRPPGRPPRKPEPTGVVGEFASEVEIPDDYPIPDFLLGTWVTSYSGWINVLPVPDRAYDPNNPNDKLPPQFDGYYYDPTNGQYVRREGYFIFAGLEYIYFDGYGNLWGHADVNRGGRDLRPEDLTGSYTLLWNPDFRIYKGTYTTIRARPDPQIDIEMTYQFLAKSSDELEFIWSTGNYRGIVASGILKRVNPM